MRVVICGGGVIGACTAYFLSRRGAEVVVVERAGVANGASGKSGGFLALDWCDGTALADLARRSFALHESLAAEIGGWDYRRVETLAVASHPGTAGGQRTVDWLGDQAMERGLLGTPETTAQVAPAAFTQGMMAAAVAEGAALQVGAVTGMAFDDDGNVAGVSVDGETLACDAAVIAMGPWSVLASEWLPLPAVYGLKGHSVVLRPRRPMTAHALFVDMTMADGSDHTPEVFCRPDGTTYVCGFRGHDPLPVDPALVTPEDGAEAQLLAMTAQFSPVLGEAEVVAAQACYRPITADGLPLMGAIPGVGGAYVATGHSVWGMLNGPASGEAVAELILDGTTTVNISAFDPGRMAALSLP